MRFADFTHQDDIAIDVELTRQVVAARSPTTPSRRGTCDPTEASYGAT